MMNTPKPNAKALNMRTPMGKPSNTKTGKAPKDWKNASGIKKK